MASSVESKVLSTKRQDKIETNLKIRRKQKEQTLGLHELVYKPGVGSSASNGFYLKSNIQILDFYIVLHDPDLSISYGGR